MQKKYSVLTIYSFGHALVDAASIAAVMGLSYQDAHYANALSVVLLYNFLAFATQPVLGLLTDKLKKPEAVSAIGCMLTAVGFLLLSFPICSIVLVGIGNALFHVGGGIISLAVDPGKAWAPGVFIAPGNLGVLIGSLTAKNANFHWFYIGLLVLAALLCAFVRLPGNNTSLTNTNTIPQKSYQKVFHAALLLILITVVIRSFTGLTVQFSWKKDMTLLIILSVFVTLGKALGGILADKIGYIKVPVIGLALSIPCIIIGFNQPAAGVIGMLLFNLTMPVTLILASNLLPESKGFAFGLTVLALSLGSIPAYSGIRLIEGYSITASILISIITLIGGYSLSKKNIKNELEVIN